MGNRSMRTYHSLGWILLQHYPSFTGHKVSHDLHKYIASITNIHSACSCTVRDITEIVNCLLSFNCEDRSKSLQSGLNSFPLLSLLNYSKLSIQLHHSPHPPHQDITSISRPMYQTTSSVNQIHPANIVTAAYAETELQHRLTLKAKITYSMNLCRMRYNL